MKRLGTLALLAALLGAAPAATAQAQGDDWSVTGGNHRPNPRGNRNPRTPGQRGNRGQPGQRGNRGQAGQREEPSAGANQRRDRNEVLIQRYLAVLESDARESFALNRLLDLYRERDGNIDALVATLEQRIAADANAFAPRMILGHIFKAQGRNDDARRAYEQALALRPDDTIPLIALAQVARSANDHARARELYERALTATREDAARQELLRSLGEIALDQEDYDGARGYYEHIARGANGSVFLLTEYARALAARSKHARAVEEYQRVLRQLSGDNRVLAPVLRELGQAQLDAGDTNAAIDTLQRALRLSGRAAGVRREIYDVVVEAYRRGDRLPELATQLEREGASFENQELLGRLHDELGNEEQALTAYRRALRSNPREIDTRVRVIQLLSRSGRIDDVIAEYRSLITLAPREPRFVVELAQLLMQAGRRDEAIRLAADTSRRYPTEAAVHQALAELYAGWGEEELAGREVATLVRIDPNDPAHLIALGAQLLEAGDRDGARAMWRRILGSEGDRARAHATLGGVYADNDMLDDAVEMYREAVRLEPEQIEYVRGLASVLERKREGQPAIEQWTRVIALAGQDRAAVREARQRIVGIWARSNLLPRQVRELERAFSATPPDIESGRFLAEAYRRMGAGQIARAEHVLERIIELAPGDVESLLALERARSSAGNLAAAIEVLQKLVEADPRRATQYLQRMAEHALALYRDEEAIRYAAMVVERSPDDANGHQRLGDLYRARQDMPNAITSYRRAIELNDRLYPTYFDLAEIHLARGELHEADELFRRVMRASPDDDLVSRATRASVQINLGEGTLEDLERDLLPLALGHPQRPIFRKLLVEAYDALTGPLIQRGRRGGADAQAAEEDLRRIGTRALKPLLEALADADPSQRRVAIDVLGHLGNENAAGPLLAAAEGEGDTALRTRALAAAGAVAGEALVPRFVALLSAPDMHLRTVAAWSLARIGGARAVAALRTLLESGEAGGRCYAALGLGRARDTASAGALTQQLRSDPTTEAQAAAAWALGRLREPSHVPALVSAMRARAGSVVASTAAVALGEIGDPRAREALAQSLFDPDPAQRAIAAEALAKLGANASTRNVAFPPPAEATRPLDYLATLVRASVGEQGPFDFEAHRDAIVDAARGALRGPQERASAALELLSSRDGDAIGLGPLTAGIERWPAADRRNAESTLENIAVALLPDLSASLQHSDARIRAAAARVIVRVHRPEAAAALAQALEDTDASVRRAALEGLGAHPSVDAAVTADAAPRIVRLLENASDWSTRMLAARTLGRMRAAAATGALTTALESDRYAFVREAAASALALTAGEGAIPALDRALAQDSEAQVRVALVRALRTLEGPRARALIERARSDSDARVREAAAVRE